MSSIKIDKKSDIDDIFHNFAQNIVVIMEEQSKIYSKHAIDFATVAVETSNFIELAVNDSKSDFISKSITILSLLYIKTSILRMSITNDEFVEAERFVTEDDYIIIKNQIAGLLGMDDSYLEVFHPDMPYSDTPIAAFISEDLADIYQELKDFSENYRIGINETMEAGLYSCLDGFSEHWGQKLLNSLRALHALRYSDNFGMDESDELNDTNEYRKLDRNKFLNLDNEEENPWLDQE